MASRNRTQRKNKNKNKNKTRSGSRTKHRGGAISCNNAQRIVNDPSAGRIKKMAAELQMKSCATGMKAVNPNMKWANTRVRVGEYGKCNSGYGPNGMTCVDGSSPRKPNNFNNATSPRPSA